MIAIYGIMLPQMPDNDINKLYMAGKDILKPHLSMAQNEYIQSFSGHGSGIRFCLARILTRLCALKALDFSSVLDMDFNGRSYFPFQAISISFSYNRTHAYCALNYSPDNSFAIDSIELAKPHESSFANFFYKCGNLTSLPHTLVALKMWTIYEAAIKITGMDNLHAKASKVANLQNLDVQAEGNFSLNSLQIFWRSAIFKDQLITMGMAAQKPDFQCLLWQHVDFTSKHFLSFSHVTSF